MSYYRISQPRVVPLSQKGLGIEELFNAGFDTFDLAAHFNIDEHEAHRLVTALRSRRIGRPDPYKNSSSEVSRKLSA